MKIGIIREGKKLADKRVPLPPHHCVALLADFPELEIVVQPSSIRSFSDEEYKQRGIILKEELVDCDVLMGVKEVPLSELIPQKKYLFFSHTIKEQPYNQKLLQHVLQNKITLIDYECLTDDRDFRIIGFGRFAGIVGCYNGLLAYGKRYKKFDLKPAHQCLDLGELHKELKKVDLPNIKIALTGGGRVANGSLEILNELKIEKVTPEEFLSGEFNEAVYCQLLPQNYTEHKENKEWSDQHFFANPSEYISTFKPFAKVTDIYISGHYWDAESPVFFTREDMMEKDFKIKIIADISCDLDGPIASTIRPSTIDEPLYGYHPESHSETAFDDENSVTVMAVDNLPCELPRDASDDFGRELVNKVIPALFEKNNAMIQRATIATEGKLTADFAYLSDYAEGKPK